MCLDVVTNWHRKDEGIGYKVFTIRGKGLITPITDTKVVTGRWLKAKVSKSVYVAHSPHYSKGFHIFRNKKHADSYRVTADPIEQVTLKVKYKGVICSGHQEDKPTLVVGQMMIEKGWRKRVSK